ncbi:hypothetical protein SDC9_66069 [bioreactor metagenome]|uniref:Uncharacterized protein n=1 Tax=bioreactor metagenome TaxID=1076179 RepID=A0A644XZE4_9ZZZZ
MHSLQMIADEIPVMGIDRRAVKSRFVMKLLVGVEGIAFHVVCPGCLRHTFKDEDWICACIDKNTL